MKPKPKVLTCPGGGGLRVLGVAGLTGPKWHGTSAVKD